MKSWARIERELSERWLGTRLSIAGRQHQYPEVLALRRLLDRFSIDTVLDVGANTGQYATMLRRDAHFRGTIISFEPNPAVFEALQRHAARDPRWRLHHLALSDRDGNADFNVMAEDQFSSLNAPSATQDRLFTEQNAVARTVSVTTRRLEGMLANELAAVAGTRCLLKLDTQGHDRAVCEGAGAALARMCAVQTELSIRPIYAGATTWRDMIDYLGDSGFTPSAMFANNEGFFPLLVEMDGLFIRRDLALHASARGPAAT